MDNSEKMKKVQQSWLLRALLIMLLDIMVIGAAFFSAFLLRFDFQFSVVMETYLYSFLLVVPVM